MEKNRCPECGYKPTIYHDEDYHCPRCSWSGQIIESKNVVKDDMH